MADPVLRSRWLPGFWLRHPLFSLAITGLFTVVFLLMAAATAYETYRLNHFGQSVSATVVEVHEDYVVARFTTADGREVVTQIDDYWRDPEPEPGDTATIVYDPEQPDQILRDTRIGGDYMTSWVILVVAIVFAAGGSIFLRRTWNVWRGNAHDWRTGDHYV